MKTLATLFLLLLGSSVTAADYPANPSNGQLYTTPAGETETWDAASANWINPMRFWMNYAATRGGLSWKTGSDYPPYSEVKEGDLFLVQLATGSCLMEFFHQRWRRAQDVRRWDPAFNNYSACPNVFK